MIKYFLILFFFYSSAAFSNEYKIQFSGIPIGQGLSENDSVGVMNSVGSMITKEVSSDSFTIGSGFLKTTQSVFFRAAGYLHVFLT